MYPKPLLFLSFFFWCLSTSAQQLRTDKITIESGSGKTTTNAVIYLPAHYSTDKQYPLVIYSHGIGEAGTDINKLYTTGLPKVLKEGYKPSFDFIMVAPQSPTYSVSPDWLPGILSDCIKQWNIDTNRVYLTGISAGGWAAYGSQLNINAAFARKVAAVAVVSGATQNVDKENFDWWKQSTTPLWAIAGGADSSYAAQSHWLAEKVNEQVAGLASVTIMPGTGHGGWNGVYNGTIKNEGKTVWEWLYQFDRGSASYPDLHATLNTTDTLPQLSTAIASNTATAAKSINVNLFGGTNSYTNTAWNNWNMGTATASTITSALFKYSDGTASGVGAVLSYTKSISDNGVSYGSGMAPAEVLRYASLSDVARTLQFKGLSALKKYSIELYATRAAAGNSTVFTVNGVSQTIYTYNNLTNKAVFTGIAPTTAGTITVNIASANTYNYINGFKISETSTETTTNVVVAPVTGGFANYTLKPSGTQIYYPNGLNISGLKGGDTVNIPAGTYTLIALGNFRGDAANPIIIRNSGGLVTTAEIRIVNDPKYFKLLGNGKAGLTYGFKVSRTQYTGINVIKASDFEIAYCEVTGMSSGIFIKSNPVSTDPSSIYPNYVFKNIYVHHNYVHHIQNEGLYIGHTDPDGGQDGNTLVPVRMENVEIAYNTVDQTGWDGIQLSNARAGNKVHHNTVTNFGTRNISGQQAGILIGANTNVSIYSNTVKVGTGCGIQVYGYGYIPVYDNVLENCAKDGTAKGRETFYANPYIAGPEVNPKQQVNIYNNTIRYPQAFGAIRIGGIAGNSLTSTIQNNRLLIVNPPSNWQSIHTYSIVSGSTITGNTLITQ
jgi:poly(3-hydroxybutyrate) depolymerase